MLVSFRLNVVVFSVFFTSEMAFIIKERHMVSQIPISLLEVGVGVVFVATGKLFLSLMIHRVSVLIWSLLFIDVMCHGKVRSLVLILLWLLLLVLFDRGRA